jgi:hypothetical protein
MKRIAMALLVLVGLLAPCTSLAQQPQTYVQQAGSGQAPKGGAAARGGSYA